VQALVQVQVPGCKGVDVEVGNKVYFPHPLNAEEGNGDACDGDDDEECW